MVYLSAIAILILNLFSVYDFALILQLDGYRVEKRSRVFAMYCGYISQCLLTAMALIVGIVVDIFLIEMSLAEIIAFWIFIAVRAVTAAYYIKRTHIKMLKFTARVKRSYMVYLLINLIIITILLYIIYYFRIIYGNLLLISLPIAVAPLLFLCATVLMRPIENTIARKYVRAAKAKLNARKDLIKIGITGSYGKTGMKYILTTMLEERYNVLKTPASYNTPMGICMTVNDLDDCTEVFVAEMGARHRGDIKELCDIVAPTYGIVTGIAPQHIETFRSIQTIEETKYELIDSLPADGYAVFNGEDEICEKMYKYTKSVPCVCVKTDSGECYADNIVTTPNGCAFELIIGKERALCDTVLIGRHNVQNILVAAAMAHRLGVGIEEISHAICRLQCAEHRLEVIRADNGITILDDTFNSNIKGVQAALDTLALFEGRKIIATPGIVDAGKRERELNIAFGEKIAAVCDLAILIGERAKFIEQGLLNAEYGVEKMIFVRNLNEAMDVFHTMLRSGDTLLLENDLPDNY